MKKLILDAGCMFLCGLDKKKGGGGGARGIRVLPLCFLITSEVSSVCYYQEAQS